MEDIFVVKKEENVVSYCESMDKAKSFCTDNRGLFQIDVYSLNRKIIHPKHTAFSKDQIVAGKFVPAFTFI